MARRCVLLLVALGGAFARKEIDLNKLDKEYRADDDDAAWETAAQKRRREAAKAAAPGAGFPGTGAPGETISNDVMQEMIARAKANGKFTQGGTGGLGAAPPPTDDDDDDGDDAAKLPFDAEPDGVWKDADNSMKLMSAFLRDGECDDVACCAEATRLFVALLRTGGVTQLMPKCMAPNELLLVLQGSSAAASSFFQADRITDRPRRSQISQMGQITDFFLERPEIGFVQHGGTRHYPNGTTGPIPPPTPRPAPPKKKKRRKKKKAADEAPDL